MGFRLKTIDGWFSVFSKLLCSIYFLCGCIGNNKNRIEDEEIKRHYIYAAIVVIIGLISLIIRNLVQFPNENFGDIVNHFLLALIPGGILGAVIYCGLCVIIAKSHKIDVEKAKQNNAIAPA